MQHNPGEAAMNAIDTKQWKVNSGQGNEFASGLKERTMTRKRHMLVAVFIAMGTIGIGANSASAAASHQVPFRASYSGTAAFNSATGTAVFTGTTVRVCDPGSS
jgi:hypothetical protein